MVAFAPVRVGGTLAGWIVTAFRIENLLRVAEPRSGIAFQIFDAGPTLQRLDAEHGSGKAPTANVGLTFKRQLPAFDRTWIVYQTRNRPVGAALLAPAGLFWLLCSGCARYRMACRHTAAPVF
jgi:hypothetical protein